MTFALMRSLRPAGARTASDTSLESDQTSQRTLVAGVTGDTRLATDFGAVPAMLLRVNDRVLDADGTYVRIRSVRMTAFEAGFLAARPGHAAIAIAAGSLGPGLPRSDIELAPDQPVFAVSENRVPLFLGAAALAGRPGIFRAAPRETAYFFPVFDAPAEILVEGARLRF